MEMQNKRTITFYIFIFAFSESFIHSKTFFRLDRTTGRIEAFGALEVAAVHTEVHVHDEIFQIICNGPTWRQSPVNISHYNYNDMDLETGNTLDDEVLDCGKPVNHSSYDNFLGISQRFTHPIRPEPESSYLFFSKKDINALERRLKKAKREKPKSVQLYNQIGNFWRIKGDTLQAIECFRRALAVSPTNAEVLLNLARVMLNLHFFDDALQLTRRSLEVHPTDKNPWRQHLTLSEILKASGSIAESQFHFKHAVDIAPEPGIKQALLDRDKVVVPSPLHVSTIFITLCLVLAVLYVLSSASDSGEASDMSNERQHFNRALFRSHHKVFRSYKCRK